MSDELNAAAQNQEINNQIHQVENIQSRLDNGENDGGPIFALRWVEVNQNVKKSKLDPMSNDYCDLKKNSILQC